MAYKSILTVLTRATDASLAIGAAARLAQDQDAHLDVLVLGVDRTQVGYSYIGSGAILMQVSLDRAEAEARDTEAAVKAALAAQTPGLRSSVEAAVTQLVVLPRPYGEGKGAEAEAIIESALFEGKAPVLVLPEKGLGDAATPKRVIVAWNQSAEAMTATRQALPFLKAAQTVDITVIDPPPHGPERSDPGGLLCQMLVRHGVHAEVSVLARSLPRVSDVLARHIWDQNADLLVMGAYGHSRFREAILGGATRNMLEKAEIPVLMAH